VLLPDRYGYAVGERVLGDPGSPLVFDQPWIGVPPADLDRAPRIVERRGCDPRPVDTGTDEGRLTLMSYVWADWIERLQRLQRALRVAATQPPTVDRAGLADWLAAELATPRPGVLTVVWHSVMWQYVERPERLRARAALQAAAAAATVDAPFAYLRFEPSRDEATGGFELRLTLAPAGPADGRLATAHGHGIPVVWA
jgi:hypothetical protein